MPDITAREEIIVQRLDRTDRPIDTMWQDFNYLDLLLPAKDAIGLEEYRTNRRSGWENSIRSPSNESGT